MTAAPTDPFAHPPGAGASWSVHSDHMPTVNELLFLAIEVSAAEAALAASEDARRAHEPRSLADYSLDQTGAGSPTDRVEAFFASLETADLLLLTALYYAARDWRGNVDGEDELQPDEELRRALGAVRRSSDAMTRETCLRKLTEVMGYNRVTEFAEALRLFSRAATAMRTEFSNP